MWPISISYELLADAVNSKSLWWLCFVIVRWQWRITWIFKRVATIEFTLLNRPLFSVHFGGPMNSWMNEWMNDTSSLNGIHGICYPGGAQAPPIRRLGAPCTLGPRLWLQWIVTKDNIFGIALILFRLHEIW